MQRAYINFNLINNLFFQTCSTMGNNNIKSHLLKIEWEKVDTYNGIEIYRNKANNQLAQKRIIMLDQDFNIEEQLKVYNMREHNSDALVRALGTQNLEEANESMLICAGRRKIFVYTEKMSHRLSECPQLTFPQCLLFLREALRGFERIYRDYGAVQVTKQLIGINYLGEIKSWLNQNWALNHRGHEYNNLGEAKLSDLTRSQYLSYRGEYMDEQQMVRNIISVIEQKCEQGRFPQAFKEQVENQSNSFKKLLLYLKDFIEYNDIYVPQRIDYENLLQVNYHKRFEYQLNYRSLDKNGQGQYSFSAGNQLNGDLTKYMQENVQYSNGYQLNNLNNNLKAPISVSDTNKQSPTSDALGRVTFSESNRIYTGDNKLTNLQWPSKTQDKFLASTYQIDEKNYGLNSYNANKDSNVQSKYEFYSSSNYKPSYQPLTFQSPFQPSKYQSSFNTFNSFNNQGQGSEYSYNYSSSYNGTAANNNSVHQSNFGPSPTFNVGTSSSNYNQISNTGYQSSFMPSATKFDVTGLKVQPLTQQVNTYTFEQAMKVQKQNKSPKTVQEFRKIADDSIQIDGKTGQKILYLSVKPLSTKYSEIQVNYQNPQLFGYSNNHGIEKTQFITNKWTSSLPGSTFQTYKLNSSSNYNNPLPNPSSETFSTSTFSFGSKLQQQSQFGSAYSGTGYSNTLAKYEPSNNLTKNLQIQGKYAEAFSNLLSPSLQQNLQKQNSDQISPQINSNNGKQASQRTPESRQKTENQSAPQSQGQKLENVQQTQTRVFQGFSNLVERASNDVSESILKQF